MYQHCPNCHRLTEESTICPHCGTRLDTPYTPPRHKLTRKELAMYTLGYLILLFLAFEGRDLTNTQQIIEGTALFAALVGISIFGFYITSRGGLGYPIS